MTGTHHDPGIEQDLGVYLPEPHLVTSTEGVNDRLHVIHRLLIPPLRCQVVPQPVGGVGTHEQDSGRHGVGFGNPGEFGESCMDCIDYSPQVVGILEGVDIFLETSEVRRRSLRGPTPNPYQDDE